MSDEKLEKELENDLKILALDCYDKGFNAGLKAEREKSKKLVEALKHITTCVERNDEHETAKISNYHRLKDARHTSERALKEYEKEGAE